MHRAVRATVVVLCVALALGACSKKTKVALATPTKLAVTAVENSPTAFSFTGAPTSVKAGLLEITLTNSGKVNHEFQIIRLEGGTPDEAKKFFIDVADQEGIPIPASLKDGGGVTEIPAGKTQTTMNLVKAGTWVYACVVSEGGSHTKKGMFGTFTVTGTSTAKLPATTATVSATEYSFATTGLKAGEKATFKNTGSQLHHFIMVPIAPGKTINDVKAFMQTQGEPAGPPPVDFEKAFGAAVMDAGNAQVLTIEATAGKYAMFCFINDRAGGPPHFTKGMIAEATVA